MEESARGGCSETFSMKLTHSSLLTHHSPFQPLTDTAGGIRSYRFPEIHAGYTLVEDDGLCCISREFIIFYFIDTSSFLNKEDYAFLPQ